MWGLDTEATRETLRELTGVRVVVEEIKPDIERAGLARSQVQTDGELRLRKARIRVLPDKEWLVTPGAPSLYIRVTTLKAHDTTGHPLGYTVFTEVSLDQDVRLARAPDLKAYRAETWRATGSLATVDVSNLRTIRG